MITRSVAVPGVNQAAGVGGRLTLLVNNDKLSFFPAKVLMEKFGFTVENVVAQAKAAVNSAR